MQHLEVGSARTRVTFDDNGGAFDSRRLGGLVARRVALFQTQRRMFLNLVFSSHFLHRTVGANVQRATRILVIVRRLVCATRRDAARRRHRLVIQYSIGDVRSICVGAHGGDSDAIAKFGFLFVKDVVEFIDEAVVEGDVETRFHELFTRLEEFEQ